MNPSSQRNGITGLLGIYFTNKSKGVSPRPINLERGFFLTEVFHPHREITGLRGISFTVKTKGR